MMKTISRIAAALTLTAAAALVMGCFYGKIRNSDVDRGQYHAFVEQNYPNLVTYYSGDREKPGAILMDLKNDRVRLIPDKWHPINSKEELLQLMDRMIQVYYGKMRGNAGTFGPQLQRVLDRNDKLIGYFFSPVDNWPVRPHGSNYSVDTVNFVQVREWSQGVWRSPGKKGRSGGGS